MTSIENTLIRLYNQKDKLACQAIFESNCPKYFDHTEREMFLKWLDHQADSSIDYKSPTYTNSETDAYFVLELPVEGVIACAGFYILKEEKEARLAWGMIHSEHHQMGFGTMLYKHRRNIIKQNWPQHRITLGTSQHTFAFYQKMGMKVLAVIKSGYGESLDRYDMEDNEM